jgi:phosphoglycerol transferase MdoB-like AlkP superfamily enzyme
LLALPPIPDWFEAVLLLYLLVFSFLSLQRVYRGKAWQTVLKGLFVAAAYGACLLLTTSVLGIAALIA